MCSYDRTLHTRTLKETRQGASSDVRRYTLLPGRICFVLSPVKESYKRGMQMSPYVYIYIYIHVYIYIYEYIYIYVYM